MNNAKFLPKNRRFGDENAKILQIAALPCPTAARCPLRFCVPPCYDNPMKKKPTTEATAALLAPCTRVLPEGFAIDLSLDLAAWDGLVRSHGARPLCRACAEWLCDAYRKAFDEPFLFSERCVAYELRWHLSAYRYAKGLSRGRPLASLPFSRARLDRSCHSVEIDANDVYRWTQRLIFFYFFGVRAAYRRTDRDPYALRLWGRLRRVPLCRKSK